MFFKNNTFNFEAKRLLQYAAVQAADINEVLSTTERIKNNDRESWYKEWLSTAQRIEKIAENDKYNLRNKGLLLARAHSYYRTAEFFLPANDKRKLPVYDSSLQTFYRSLDFQNIDYKKLEIPYESTNLSAVFFPAKSSSEAKALIVIVNGYDSYKEETYFMFAKTAVENGYSVIVYDGPGQGEAIRKNNIRMTHEWEKPNGAVLDYFISYYYQPKNIVLLGYSLGGILVTRAAAFDKRISGIINFDIFYDFAEAAMFHTPQNIKKAIINNNKLSKTSQFVMRKMLAFDPHFNWAMTQGEFVFRMNRERPWEILHEYTNYTIKDIADKVTCKVLLLAGDEDHFVPKSFLELNKQALTNASDLETILYTKESGGQEHCQVGAMLTWHADVLEWLSKKFE